MCNVVTTMTATNTMTVCNPGEFPFGEFASRTFFVCLARGDIPFCGGLLLVARTRQQRNEDTTERRDR